MIVTRDNDYVYAAYSLQRNHLNPGYAIFGGYWLRSDPKVHYLLLDSWRLDAGTPEEAAEIIESELDSITDDVKRLLKQRVMPVMVTEEVLMAMGIDPQCEHNAGMFST